MVTSFLLFCCWDRVCCNLCVALVAYLSFCLACSYWLDWSNQQLCFRSRLLQFVCSTCRVPVFLLPLAPIGWINPISSFVSGRGYCNFCAARVAYGTCWRFWETFCFAFSHWLNWSNQQLSFRSRLLQFVRHVSHTCLVASRAPIGWIDPI